MQAVSRATARPRARPPGPDGDPRSEHPRRLVLLLALMTLGPLAVLNIAALRLSADAARSQAKRQVASSAAASAVAVQQELRGLTDVVASFADRPVLRSALSGGDGRPADGETLRSQLAELLASRSGVDLAFVTDPAGTLLDILPASPSIVGQGFAHRDWYRGVVASGRPYVSEVYETAATGGGLVVAAAAPVRAATGAPGPPIAVLVAGYRIDTVQRFVDDFAAAQGVSLTVVDQRGVVVASPGAGPGRMVSRRADDGVAAALAGRSGTAQVRRAGEAVLTAHVPVKDLGWAVVADLPARVVLAERGPLRTAIVGVTAALAVVLGGGLLVFDRALRRRSAAEEQLRDSRRFLDSVVENIPNMVFVKDAADLRFVRFNRAGESLLGYRREELVGRNDFDLFPPEEAERFVAGDREVLDSGEMADIPIEPVQTRADGQRLLHTRKIPILGADGAPQYLLGISEDITERRQADAALEEARDAAHRASHAKNQFLSRMSHELRTPLNAVLGFGQLLQLDGLRPDQQDSVDHIVRAGAHLLELIDEVLDISRVEEGHLRLSLEPVSVEEVVADALGMVRPLAAARGVALSEVVPGGDRHVRADRQRLRQVLVNLLANAVKYNRDDGEVTLRCEPAGGSLRLVVDDTGIGLSPHDQGRLFQPFERLGAEHTDVEGTGLGLALTKQLVEVMGGAIGVTSEVGVGSSFWVELPLTEAPSEKAAGPALPLAARPPSADVARTVLYVEDNLSNVKLVERVVARRPEVDLMVAMHGSLAIELAREHRPSLILLDLHLPDMSGEEVLRRLRADARTAATPVVVLSADATSGQVERLRASGAADYLTKPFDIPRLLAVIDGSAIPGGGGGAVPDGPDDATLDASTVAALVELAGDSPSGVAGVREAVCTYLDEGASRLAGLRVAVAGGDAVLAERLAHSMAGSSATFGARLVADGCRILEVRAKSGDLDEAPSLVARVEGAFDEAAAALRRQFLEGQGTPS